MNCVGLRGLNAEQCCRVAAGGGVVPQEEEGSDGGDQDENCDDLEEIVGSPGGEIEILGRN